VSAQARLAEAVHPFPTLVAPHVLEHSDAHHFVELLIGADVAPNHAENTRTREAVRSIAPLASTGL
jgi:hypothetical protein